MYCSNFNNYVNDAKQIQNDAVRKTLVIQYLASNIITMADPKQNCQHVKAVNGDSTINLESSNSVCTTFVHHDVESFQGITSRNTSVMDCYVLLEKITISKYHCTNHLFY